MRTTGNFLTLGPAGERRAAFATKADQTLFSAAPELLAALKLAWPSIGNHGDAPLADTAAYKAARAAIAKAEGNDGLTRERERIAKQVESAHRAR